MPEPTSLSRPAAGPGEPSGGISGRRRVLAAPDKFRGSATAPEVAAAMVEGVRLAGGDAAALPLADGGEGFLDAFAAGAAPDGTRGWRWRTRSVTGPAGVPVEAAWLLGDGVAVVEAARTSGLLLAGGATGNDPWAASSAGVGELLAEAATAVGPGGTVFVGVGGTACTDGGLAAVEAVRAAGGLHGASVVGAVDVHVPFLDAARRFGPQKGAAPAVVDRLTTRLAGVAAGYRRDTGVDVLDAPGAGAGGGLGGALLVLGGRLRPGFEVVADRVGLDDALDRVDLVVTGEGRLDSTSFAGKVVGAVLDRARARDLPAAVVVGRSTDEGRRGAAARGARVVDLTAEMGASRAEGQVGRAVTDAVRRLVVTAD